jgi:hypothetical protein
MSLYYVYDKDKKIELAKEIKSLIYFDLASR